jgi:hypothetical protein
MYTGRRAWAGRSIMQILHARTNQHERLDLPQGCSPGYRVRRAAACHTNHRCVRPVGAAVRRIPALFHRAPLESGALVGPALLNPAHPLPSPPILAAELGGELPAG